jgi:hypothetical protein
MTRPQESLTGGHVASPGGQVSLCYQVDMTCFTELRLSASHNHAAVFGLLGVGVDRQYVLDRWGTPVHYVRNHSDERVAGSFMRLLNLVGNWSQGGTTEAAEALQHVKYLWDFLKAMSYKNADDFCFIDEQECRIVFTEEQRKHGRIVPTGQPRPQYRLPISSGELRLVVFPDQETRALAAADSRLTPYFSVELLMLTLHECEQF